MQNSINPFPNTPFSDRPKFKEAADINGNVAIKVTPIQPSKNL